LGNRKMEDIPQEEYEASVHEFIKLHPQNLLKNCSLTKELDDSAQGTGFAFIVMADVFTKIPGAPFWSALFFMMLLSLGLGSQIGIMEGVMSTLFDQPSLKHVKKPILVGCVALGCFTIGLIFTTGAGEYWLTLFDSFGATGLTFIAFAELLSVMYVYGHTKFTKDIENMTGVRPGIYWQLMWRFISPTLMAAVIASSTYFMFTNTPVYTAWNRKMAAGEKKEYGGLALGVAALLAVSSLIPILVGLVVHLVKRFRPRDNKHAYQAGKFYRVDTTASTRPMLGDNYEDFPSLPLGEDISDTDSGEGIVMEEEEGKPFKLEVMD